MNYLTTLALIFLMLQGALAQDPSVNIVWETVPIPEAAYDQIVADFGSDVVTTRVYLEVPENWEVQFIYGILDTPWSLNSPNGGFYQHPFGGPTSLDIDPDLYASTPTLQYDSWVTIGAPDQTNNQMYLVPDESIFATFENGGSGFTVDSAIGGGIYVTTFGQTPQNYPDANGRILIGQFTNSGSFSYCINVQLRQLNPDGTIYDPDGPGPLYSNTVQINDMCADVIYAGSCTCDFNFSYNVDVADLLLLISEFGCNFGCNYDADGDDMVSVADMLLLLSEFGDSCY